MSARLPAFLADTWWFGLTTRLSPERFRETASLRVEQGFSAVQLVVGIPPEVGPEHPSAASEVGFPLDRHGVPNQAYLALARERIGQLNALGLTAIVYGGWGHQMGWFGAPAFCRWWARLVQTLDDLDVVWCLTGEIDLAIGRERQLLPDRATDSPPRPIARALARLQPAVDRGLRRLLLGRRLAAWSRVLGDLAARTTRPILIHPTPWITGRRSVSNPELLAADTIQSGHDAGTRPHLWQLPHALHARAPGDPGIINLEPWYEGIRDQFYGEDQLFAYWASVLSGARAHGYGAHGVWNVGDGSFLAHWGRQTFDQALALDTPRLLGASHGVWADLGVDLAEPGEITLAHDGERLVSVCRRHAGSRVTFAPDVAALEALPPGRPWLPLAGRYGATVPGSGPVVFIDAGTGPAATTGPTPPPSTPTS